MGINKSTTHDYALRFQRKLGLNDIAIFSYCEYEYGSIVYFIQFHDKEPVKNFDRYGGTNTSWPYICDKFYVWKEPKID